MSQREYEKAVVELHSSGASPVAQADEEFVRRRELDLNIDHRLGTEFPAERREQLWRIQQEIEKRRLRLAAGWLLARLAPSRLHKRANRVAGFVVDAYSAVLSQDELEAYFGADEVRNPSLPLDQV